MKAPGIFDFFKSKLQATLNLDEESHDSPAKYNVQSNIPYDAKLYPPNIAQSEQHSHARRVSIPLQVDQQKREAVDVCDCCGYPVENTEVPLCCNPKELLFLGTGFPLFFEFMKTAIGMLFMIMLISGLYNIWTNISAHDCDDGLQIHEKPCTFDYFTETSLVNKAHHLDYIQKQEILNLVSVLFCALLMHVLRFQQRKLAFDCDLGIVTASDYTLQIGNLPENLEEEKLREYLQNIPTPEEADSKVGSIIVEKINLCYYVSRFMDLLNEQSDLSNKLLFYESVKESLQTEIQTSEIDLEKMLAQKNLEKIHRDDARDRKRLEQVELGLKERKKNFKVECKFAKIAFVTFAIPAHAQIVKAFFRIGRIQGVKRSLYKTLGRESPLLFEGHALTVERAPEPNEILWENLGVPETSRLKQKIITWFMTFLCLFLSFVSISMVFYLQMLTSELTDSNKVKYIISYTGCFLIVIINNGLVMVVTYLTKMEKHENLTEYNTSLTQKKTAALFLNTACIYLLVAIWVNSFFGSSGLIYNVISVFASNMVMQPLLFLFFPSYLLKLWKQRKMMKNPKAYPITQEQANKIFEGMEFEITVCYAGVLNIMLFGAFYTPLLPLSLFFAILTLTIYYWTFKYILLRRCCTPNFLGKKIGYEAIEIMEFVPLFLALGDVLFNLIFYGKSGVVSYVTLGISIFNFLFPMGWLNRKILPFEEKKKFRIENPNNTTLYNTARINFTEEYDRSNPMTHELAHQQWLKFKEGRPVSIYETHQEEEQFQKEKVKRSSIGKKPVKKEEVSQTMHEERKPLIKDQELSENNEIDLIEEDPLASLSLYASKRKSTMTGKRAFFMRNLG